MNHSLTLAFLIAAGIGLVVQNTLMVRITQTTSTILIAMLLFTGRDRAIRVYFVV